MKKLLIATALLAPLLGCSQPAIDLSNRSSAESAERKTSNAKTVGTLEVRANGEDFVRQGFVDKDGWQISFDHVYVTLADIVATQQDPTAEAAKSEQTQTQEALQQVTSAEAITVDLAAGDENAAPVLVTQIENAPTGRYNALAWQMVTPTSGESAGYPLVLIGTATKAGNSIPFEIKLTSELIFECGDFIGEERKGILTDGQTAEVEATFHFDHIFGDAEAAADDEINTGALGFGVLADLVTNDELNVTSKELETQLSPENYNNLETVLTSLGHVGEGHCEATLVKE